MTSDAEKRLKQRGLPIEEVDLERPEEPNVIGYVVTWPEEDAANIVAMCRPNLTRDQRGRFAEWLEERIDRYFEHGVEPDGWQRRNSDGGWQL